VFSVETVTGWKPGGLGYQEYVPFESFEHDPVSTCPTAVRITASASVPLAA
jgi:type VI secretion system protein ImpG